MPLSSYQGLSQILKRIIESFTVLSLFLSCYLQDKIPHFGLGCLGAWVHYCWVNGEVGDRVLISFVFPHPTPRNVCPGAWHIRLFTVLAQYDFLNEKLSKCNSEVC